jgi:hypothetical protein
MVVVMMVMVEVLLLTGTAAGVDGVVVGALANEDQVGEAKVAGQGYC